MAEKKDREHETEKDQERESKAEERGNKPEAAHREAAEPSRRIPTGTGQRERGMPGGPAADIPGVAASPEVNTESWGGWADGVPPQNPRPQSQEVMAKIEAEHPEAIRNEPAEAVLDPRSRPFARFQERVRAGRHARSHQVALEEQRRHRARLAFEGSIPGGRPLEMEGLASLQDNRPPGEVLRQKLYVNVRCTGSIEDDKAEAIAEAAIQLVEACRAAGLEPQQADVSGTPF